VSRLSPSVAASHILSSCATLHTSGCLIPFIIGHVSPRNTITRVVSVMSLYVSTVTHMDVPSAVLQTGSSH
jgi:hypothetical protein